MGNQVSHVRPPPLTSTPITGSPIVDPAGDADLRTRHNPPATGAVDRFIRRFSVISHLIAVLTLYTVAATGVGVAFFIAGFALLLVVPIYNFLLPTRVKPFKGGYFSIASVPWAVHNALFYLVRYTFLPYRTEGHGDGRCRDRPRCHRAAALGVASRLKSGRRRNLGRRPCAADQPRGDGAIRASQMTGWRCGARTLSAASSRRRRSARAWKSVESP